VSRFRPAALLAGCSLLAACTAAPPAGGPGEPATPRADLRRQPSEAENLLSYFAQLRKLPQAELAREHEAARQAYAGLRSDYNRVRLAMVVAQPGTAFHDEPRALELLEPPARTGGHLSGLAYLLVTQISERRRLDASAQALQQKLDALKSLERSLLERKR
jgi:hypothetical protein